MAGAYRGTNVSFAEEEDRIKFWADRWNASMLGWQVIGVNRHLLKHFKYLYSDEERANYAKKAQIPRIVIPLCGKTHDMAFLAREGIAVVGMEGVKKAIDEFAAEQGLTGRTVPVALPPVMQTDRFKMHAVLIGAGDGEATRKSPPPPVLIVEGDFLAISPADASGIVSFAAGFDRGGIVAVQPKERPTYAKVLASLIEPGGRLLMVLTEHDPFAQGRLGPPYSIVEDEVHGLFGSDFEVKLLEKIPDDDGAKDKGCTYFTECVYLLRRKGA